MTESLSWVGRLPRSIRVLLRPAATFREVAASGRGFGALFGLLSIEFVLARSGDVASGLLRILASPAAGLTALWSAFVQFALPPAVALFLVGVALYFKARRTDRRVDLWTGASIVAYAWVPHVLLVALGVILAGFGLDHPVMPQHPFGHPALSDGLKIVKVGVELVPTILFVVVAFRTALGAERSDPGPLPLARVVATLAVAGTLLLGGFASAGHTTWSNWASVRPLLPGDALPAFALPGVDGSQIQRADLAGQVVLIDFWATWCPPCVESMPHLEDLHRDLSSRGFRLLSINTEPDNIRGVRAFIREHGLTFPVYIDRGLQARFRVDTLPTAFLVAPDGEVEELYIGAVSSGQLREAIEPLLPRRD
jgi:peroxiredoxin